MKPIFALLGVACLLSSTFGDQQRCAISLDYAKETTNPLSDFAIKLYKRIAAANPDKNIVFSPASIALALALLEQGAGGESKAELDRILFGGPRPDPNGASYYESLHQLLKVNNANLTLTVANGIFIGESFRFKGNFFLKSKCYDAEAKTLNFGDTAGAAREINTWVSVATNRRIQNLVSADSIRGAKALLTNAIYLKAAWQDKLRVRPEQVDFYRFGRDNEKQKVTFVQEVDYFDYAADDAFEVVKIPYTDELLSFVIVLPKQRNGIATVEQQLTPERFHALKGRFTRKRLDLQFPRFTIRTPTTLTDHLKALGLNKIFSDAADLSGLSDQALKVDSVIHEAFIKVNENGTEAAAATAIKITPLSMPPPPSPFIVDHPFIFGIVHEATKAPVFLGKVNYVEEEQVDKSVVRPPIRP